MPLEKGIEPMINGSAPPGAAAPPGPDRPPVLSIVRGSPSTEEIVAVLVTVAAAARQAPASQVAAAGRIRFGWSSRSPQLRQPLPHGPGGWRASALPR
jgi:hypothetical protein